MNKEELAAYLTGIKRLSRTGGGGFFIWRSAKWVLDERPHLLDALRRLPPGGKVLEIGIGSGRAIKELRKLFPHLKFVGTNVVEKTPWWQVWKRPTGGSVKSYGETLPFKKNSFDLVYAVEMLDYVVDKLKMIGEVHRVLKKNGRGFIDASPTEPGIKLKTESGERRIDLKTAPDIKVHAQLQRRAHIEIVKKAARFENPFELSPEHTRVAPRTNKAPHGIMSIYRRKS